MALYDTLYNGKTGDDAGKKAEAPAPKAKEGKGKIARLKDIIAHIFTPIAPSAKAEAVMADRKKRLEKMGGKNPGGAFDIIYKKTQEKNDALDELRREGL